MNKKTHIWGGIAAGEAMALVFNAGDADMKSLLFVAFGAVGALLPDIDHPKSTISNANFVTKATSEVVGVVTKHRGILHTPIFPIVFGILLAITKPYTDFYGYAQYICEGALAGYFSHLILDALNPAGIMVFWPFSKRHIHLARIHTGGYGEHIIKVLLMVGSFVLLCLMCITDIIVFTRGYSLGGIF